MHENIKEATHEKYRSTTLWLRRRKKKTKISGFSVRSNVGICRSYLSGEDNDATAKNRNPAIEHIDAQMWKQPTNKLDKTNENLRYRANRSEFEKINGSKRKQGLPTD